MSQNRIRFLAASAALAALAIPSQALMVDYSTGVFLGSGDDSAFGFTLGGTGFTYYGTNYGSMFACTNGFVSAVSNTAFSNASFPTSVARIAPFWDDWFSQGTGQGVYHNSALDYDAISWNSGFFSSVNGTGVGTFQTILVRNNTTIAGASLLAGDIVFDFDTLGSPGSGLTIGSGTTGIDRGNSADFVYSSGHSGSAVDGATMNLWGGGYYYLFRNNGQGGYDAGLRVVPEPASMAVLGLGALALLRRRRK